MAVCIDVGVLGRSLGGRGTGDVMWYCGTAAGGTDKPTVTNIYVRRSASKP